MNFRIDYALVALLIGASAQGVTAAEDSLTVTYARERVSLRAHQVVLPELLDRIAKTTCLRYQLSAEFPFIRQDWNLSNIALNEALIEITRPYNVAIFNEESGDSGTDKCIRVSFLSMEFPTPKIHTPATLTMIDETQRLDRLVNVVKQDGDIGARRQAINDLATLPSPMALRGLESVLGTSSPILRREVVEALARINDGAPPTAVGQALLGDTDPTVRLSAVEALALRNGDIEKMFLREALKDKDADVRRAASLALKRLERR